jgi:hypothetical protein
VADELGMDAVSDSPAVAQAQIGTTVGSSTLVAAATADVLLVDSNPTDITALMRDGRARKGRYACREAGSLPLLSEFAGDILRKRVEILVYVNLSAKSPRLSHARCPVIRQKYGNRFSGEPVRGPPRRRRRL